MLVRQDLNEQAYRVLKQRILTGTLRPGQRLSAVALAEDLGVSRTPITLALDRLAREGLVRSEPRVGAFVAELSIQDVAEVFDVRLLIEPGAAELCLRHASTDELVQLRRLVDDMAPLCVGSEFTDYDTLSARDSEFHRLIVVGAHNARLLALYEALSVQVQIVRIYYLNLRNAREVREQHEAIMAALEQRDAVAVRQAVSEHILSVKDAALRAYEQSDLPSK